MMRTKEQARGSLSVFFAMILPLMFSLCFSMLEVTRICGLNQNSQELTRQMLENAFSEYQPTLWKDYKILALDMGYASGQAKTDNISERMLELGSWYGIKGDNTSYDGDQSFVGEFMLLVPELCQVTSYGLLTDQNGAPLIRQGADVARGSIGEQLLEKWVKDTQEAKETQERSPGMDDLVEQGKQALQEAKKQAQEQEQSGDGVQSVPAQGELLEMEDNPFDLFEEWKEKGLLSLLVSSETELASGYLDIGATVSGRNRMQGTRQDITNVGLVDKVLFGQYILDTFSRFSGQQAQEEEKSHTLRYETEYVIGKKASDRENLEAVAARILLLREAQNIAAIYADPVKIGQAKQAAVSLAAFTANPVVIEVVQVAVIAVWAFVESVLDVRLLLTGGTVPIIKDQTQWTSDLTHLGQYVSVEKKAKDSGQGMTYTDYLRVFLALEPVKTLGLRACDVMEQKIRGTEGYENVCMDHMVYEMEVTCSYQAQPLFFHFVWPLGQKLPSYSFTKEGAMSYL